MTIASYMWKKGTLAGLLAGCLLAGSALPAHAALGGNAASVDTDAAAMQGTMTPASSPQAEQSPTASSSAVETGSAAETASYTVRSFVTARGVKIREYVAPSGTIFGVGWEGHRPPDLTVLLGSYYGEYATASEAVRHKDLHRSRTVGTNTVVVMSGRFGHVTGSAYVPGLVPSGVDAKTVVK